MPKTTINHPVLMAFRCTHDERQKLERLACETELGLSGVIRELIEQAKIDKRPQILLDAGSQAERA